MTAALLLLREALRELLSGWRQALRAYWILPLCFVAMGLAIAPVVVLITQDDRRVLLPLLLVLATAGTVVFSAVAIRWHRHLILQEPQSSLAPSFGPGVASYTWRLLLLSIAYIVIGSVTTSSIIDLFLPIVGAIFDGDVPPWLDAVMNVDRKSNPYFVAWNAMCVAIFVVFFRRMLFNLPKLALANSATGKKLAIPPGLRRALFVVYMAPIFSRVGHNFFYDWFGGFSTIGSIVDFVILAVLPVFFFAVGVSVLSVAYRAALANSNA